MRCAYPIFIGYSNTLFPVQAISLHTYLDLVLLCSDAAFVAVRQGRPDEAADWYLTTLQMAQHHRHGDIQFYADYARRSSVESLNRLMSTATLSDDSLRRIIAELRRAEYSPEEWCEMVRERYTWRRWITV